MARSGTSVRYTTRRAVSAENATYPWLRGVIPDVPDLHAGLFPHLSLDGVLEGLARLVEAGQAGPESLRPFLLHDTNLR